MNVLIVDDDVDLAHSLKSLLEINKIEICDIAHNGKVGVEYFKKYKPDVVLLDLMMPEYNGFYCFENIRKLDSYAKIIIMTANPEQSALIFVEDPDIRIFEKPLSIKELVNEIKYLVIHNSKI